MFSARGQYGRAQPRVAGRVAAAHAGGYRNFLDQFGEDLSAFGIVRTLFVLDARPFIMT
jgi:hypothetical protein